ncbi:hypothetical protein M011DRAFT_470243 [Sporormia fimetaria CBS 119925]|uniref:RAVE complex protein Rav1 C-terminal domain-containing protein n=1 Tax=Sporormia fimetaria CBS 119925 TaxID=1340428 RepID=A0A6A6V2F2_9PLEO|nr:hypothetical protein M011DRAFT_470243 [Sporormia fimetaria CBS 119925]
MRGILPGRPQAKLQAVTHGLWQGTQIIAYISGNSFVALDRPNHVLQTTYIDGEDELDAITLQEVTGKLAVCSATRIYVYQAYWQIGEDGYEPSAHPESDSHNLHLKWVLQGTLSLPDPEDTITTLSWGMPDELLAGSGSLTLFNTHGTLEQVWTKQLANPVKFAQFSPDAEMIASTGQHDRLLKIWRRRTFGSSSPSFDYSYLPHPMPVTGVHWRLPLHREQSIENVLYTICADDKVRIWVPSEHHGAEGLNLWADVDLAESIQPRSVAAGETSKKRYAFFIDGKHFTHAVERVVEQATSDEKDQVGVHHLLEVANRSPEICIVLDDRGNMSAWGFENIGARTRKTSDVFNIAHVDGLRLHFAKNPMGLHDNVQFYPFCGERPEPFSDDQHVPAFTILSHHFDGRIEWLESRIDYLFDPSPQTRRIQRKTIWTGHSHAAKKVNRTASGRALISRTVGDECMVWLQRNTEQGVTLHRHSTVTDTDHIHRTLLLHEGDFVVFLHHERICLFDTRGPVAQEMVCCRYQLRGKPLCLLQVPETEVGGTCIHIATISSEMKGITWELRLPPQQRDPATGRRLSVAPVNGVHANGDSRITMEEFSTFDLGSGNDLVYVLPVDPAGTPHVISGFLDTFARDIAMSYTKSGVITTWTARVDKSNRNVEWLQTATVETGFPDPALASGTDIRKAALIDTHRTTLTIWNTRSGQLEYEEKFESHGEIKDLDWSSTPDNQSILAVGFPHRVLVYAQLRYDYLNAGPSWVRIREVSIRNATPHPIGDSVWLGSGNLVICAGNQLYIQDEQVQVSEGLFPSLRMHKTASVDIFTTVRRLNGPLPVYHPQLLSQCVLAGKLMLAQQILMSLYQKLKFFTSGDELDSFLDMSAEDFSQDQEPQMTASRKDITSSYADFSEDTEPTTLTEEMAGNINELLTQKEVPYLSSREQFHLADIVECIGTVEKHRRSIDDNAGRFLLFFRQHALRDNHSLKPISWREITWAYHSTSQDILVDLVSRHFSGRMLWQHAKASGMFMWLTDTNAIRAQFEVIARNEYTKTEDKNPVDCSLHYIALRKKAVLVGLWRMATWSREQGATHRLLSNNFNEDRWKTAALKNAYALMGRRRFEYAAAFFLLADHLSEAVNVLHNQLGDTQLAIAVARVYEGDEGPVLRAFLTDKILPQAARDGNRWLATWAYWMLNRRDNAVRALVTPLSTLMSPPETPNLKAKSYLTDDPALVVLYRQLREKSLQTLRGATMVGMREEWDFVIHTAGLYQRMGCDLLALDLVRTWDFLAPPPPKRIPHSPATQTPSSPTLSRISTDLEQLDIDPRKLLRRRSSLVIDDMSTKQRVKELLERAKAEREEREKGKMEEKEEKKPPPTQFHEPEAESLLDAFGF